MNLADCNSRLTVNCGLAATCYPQVTEFAFAENPSSCTWHQNNYPSVDFDGETVRNCFAAATDLMSGAANYRGVVTAASINATTLLTEEFVMTLTSTIRLTCDYDGVISYTLPTTGTISDTGMRQ